MGWVSIDRTYYCDGPGCECHVQTATPPPYLPTPFLVVREPNPSGDSIRHFCSWDCLMKLAATFPVAERIEP